MKKMIALFLSFVLSFSLCACGTTDNTGGSGQQNDVDKPLNVQLAGDWYCTNYEMDLGLSLNADGTTGEQSKTWSVSDDTVTIVENIKDRTETSNFELKFVNGLYVLVGEHKTYVQYKRSLTSDPLSYTEITLTTENWQEYFEYGTYTSVEKDQWGEETGLTHTYYYVRLKQAFYERFALAKSSKALVRYRHPDGLGNVIDRDGRCQSERCGDTYFFGWYLESDPTKCEVEMLRIEGTIALINFQ